MPHSRRDQTQGRKGGAEPANLFDAPTPAIVQKDKVSTRYSSAIFQEQQREVADKPYEPTFSGRSKHSPLYFLLQKDRTSAEKGVVGELFEEAKAIGRFVREASSEFKDLLDIGNPVFNAPQDAVLKVASNEGLRAGVKRFENSAGLGFIEEDDDVDKTKKTTPSDSAGDSQVAQIHAQTQTIITRDKLIDQTIGVISEGTSDPEAQFQREAMLEELFLEKAGHENELLELQDALSVQNAIFDIQADEAGLEDVLGDIEPLTAALIEEQSLGSLTYEAIQEIAENAALSEKDRNEAIDIILTRQRFSEEITKTINDVVTNSNNLNELITKFQADEIFDVGAFLDPSLLFDTDGDNDSERFQANMESVVDAIISAPTRIPEGDPSFDAWENIMLGAMRFGLDNDEVQDEIADVAIAWALTTEEINDAIQEGIDLAVENEEIWHRAVDQDQLIPGSRGMSAAIYHAGEDIGMDPELLSLAAKSSALHALIDVQSGGKSGIRGDGNIAGIGGLTMAVYAEVMEGEWTPERGMAWELQALLEYIRRRFDGDALRAVTFWRDSKEWGGTEAMPGPGPNIGSRALNNG